MESNSYITKYIVTQIKNKNYHHNEWKKNYFLRFGNCSLSVSIRDTLKHIVKRQIKLWVSNFTEFEQIYIRVKITTKNKFQQNTDEKTLKNVRTPILA